ncbi:hypothetical protein N2152v2_004293 [Parachlorella kessleri]
MAEISFLGSSTTEDSVEEEIELLKNEIVLLRLFLQRVDPEALLLLADQSQTQVEPGGLVIGEKAEICSQEIEQCARGIERCIADGDAQQAHLAAATAECKLRVAETTKDFHDLLKLLCLSEGPVKSSQGTSAAEQGGKDPSSSGAAKAGTLRLPAATQLAKTAVSGEKLSKFLGEYLRRHDTSIERLHVRASMLKLKIQHAQAQQKLDMHNTESVALKTDTGTAVQVLADLRDSLTGTASEIAALQRQMELAEKQLGALRTSVAKVQGECEALERECEGLRRQKKDDGDTAHILDYIKMRNAVQEAQKKVADLHRKIEVASLKARK